MPKCAGLEAFAALLGSASKVAATNAVVRDSSRRERRPVPSIRFGSRIRFASSSAALWPSGPCGLMSWPKLAHKFPV